MAGVALTFSHRLDERSPSLLKTGRRRADQPRVYETREPRRRANVQRKDIVMKKAILVLLILASCGGDEGWSDQARTDFVAGCVDGGAEESLCECLQEKLEAAHPDLDDPADLDQSEVVDFTKECAA